MKIIKLITVLLGSLVLTVIGYSGFGFVLNRLLPPFYHFYLVVPSFDWIPSLIGTKYDDNIYFTAMLLGIFWSGAWISFSAYYFLRLKKKRNYALFLLGWILIFYTSFCASYFFAIWIPGA